MTYKDTLFFVGQCLTINHEEKNKVAIEAQLATGTVDWEAVVKLSTAHYVFPALYLNLQRADFLHYLPEDLVGYMEHITDLNRERNIQIMAQAKEINELLVAEGITPIFLKGTGNLLEGLYEDIAERMVGDIDFIVSKEEYQITIKILKQFGYEKVSKDNYPEFKHYPRLHKKDAKSIASIEVHKELVLEKYAHEFNYGLIKKDTQYINNIHVLSDVNQLNLSIIAKQINDKGMYYKNISLRNTYDIFLLSRKTCPKKAIGNFKKLFETMNCYLAVCYEITGKIPSIKFTENLKTNSYLNIVNSYLNDDSLRIKATETALKKLFILRKLEFFKKLFINKEFRRWLAVRARDKKWQQEKLLQLGLKKILNFLK